MHSGDARLSRRLSVIWAWAAAEKTYAVGDAVGDAVGASVGDAVGATVGDAVGASVGDAVGLRVGAFVSSMQIMKPLSVPEFPVFHRI